MLEVPREPTRVGIDGERRVRVQRIARLAGLVRLQQRARVVGVARAEIGEARLRIVAARRPDRGAAALLERNAVPALIAGLAGLRDRAETPRDLARLNVEADDLRA